MSWLFYALCAFVALELFVAYVDFKYTEHDFDKGLATTIFGICLVIACVICVIIRCSTVPNPKRENWLTDVSFFNKDSVPVKYEIAQETMMFSRTMTVVIQPKETKYLSRCTGGGYRIISEVALDNIETAYDKLMKGN